MDSELEVISKTVWNLNPLTSFSILFLAIGRQWKHFRYPISDYGGLWCHTLSGRNASLSQSRLSATCRGCDSCKVGEFWLPIKRSHVKHGFPGFRLLLDYKNRYDAHFAVAGRRLGSAKCDSSQPPRYNQNSTLKILVKTDGLVLCLLLFSFFEFFPLSCCVPLLPPWVLQGRHIVAGQCLSLSVREWMSTSPRILLQSELRLSSLHS